MLEIFFKMYQNYINCKLLLYLRSKNYFVIRIARNLAWLSPPFLKLERFFDLFEEFKFLRDRFKVEFLKDNDRWQHCNCCTRYGCQCIFFSCLKNCFYC